LAEVIDVQGFPVEPPLRKARRYGVHLLLFLLTFFTTTLAGVGWLNKIPTELTNFRHGLPYSLSLMAMLSAHEFGHYFAALRHRVKATLPFFLPFPSFFGLVPFGTLGAVIRLQSPITSRRVLFDIGAAGPIAGFLVSLGLLVYGFMSLPPLSYLHAIHPEYAQLASIPEGGLRFGDTLLYSFLAATLPPPGSFVPPMNEIYHYPFLCVGWFGLFVTAMNLIPIGQLDGGHISFSMFGNGYHRIAQTALVLLVLSGLAGFLPIVGIPFAWGWQGWLLWALMLILFMRRFGLNRPPVDDPTPLDGTRMAIGWLCWLIFLSSFAPVPLFIPEGLGM
jgi:membrane-associated protease RseP (regulator of RpoE activity)